MNQPKYMYLVVYREDAYGPVFNSTKLYTDEAAAWAYCKMRNAEDDGYYFFSCKVEIQE